MRFLSPAKATLSSDDGLLAVGSGSSYALAAARALMKHSELSAREIAGAVLRRHLHHQFRDRHRRTVNNTMAIYLSGETAETAKQMLDDLTPREIVEQLDKYVVGQTAAKRAVAVALRNRIRRQKHSRDHGDVLPKNILMIGSTGVGRPRS
jgi:AAA+ superfamily predicted ATPase